MARVYRIEDAKGRGPYTTVCSANWRDCTHHKETGRPVPEEDWNYAWYGSARLKAGDVDLGRIDFRFGFLSLAQLTAWFSKEERKKLWEIYKMRVSVYDAKIVKKSKKQVVFLFDKVEKKGYIPPRKRPAQRVKETFKVLGELTSL